MEIKEFTIKDLKEAIRKNNLWDSEVIPITKHRAIAQVHNPRADEDDIALLVGYENDKIVSYMGILPDKIFIDDTEHKIGWLSCWWVDPNHRGKGFGRPLLFKALDLYDQSIMLAGFTESARRVYEASEKFVTLKELKGMIVILRSCSNAILPKRFPKIRKFSLILKFLDSIVNIFANLRLFIWKHKNNVFKSIKIEYISEIDLETKKFITKHRKNELTKRDSNELNWIFRYPWILSSPISDITSLKYFFSSVSERYLYLNVKVFDSKNEMIGFLMIQVNKDNLTIPYSCFENEHADRILYFIGILMIEMNIYTLETYNDDLLKSFSRIKFPFLYKIRRSRFFLASKKFKDINFNNFTIQDGDSDCAFTSI